MWYVFASLGNGEYRRFECKDDAELSALKIGLFLGNREFVVVKASKCDDYR